MDNIFEILIYLIIIISFLSSIFKKKQQPQKKPPVQQPRQEDYYQAEVSAPQTQTKQDYDILRELEDFFKVGSELPGQEKTAATQREEQKAMTKNQEHTLDENWHTPTASEHSADDWEHKKTEVKKRIERIDTKIEKQAAMFEESLVKKEVVYSSIAMTVKSKIVNPSTLKEYIIFSEILGKPKALRR